MKNNWFKRLLAAVIGALMVFSVACTSPAPSATVPNSVPPTTTAPAATENGEENQSQSPENGAKKILSQLRKVYTTAENYEEVSFAHYEETPDILLIDLQTACEKFLEVDLKGRAGFTYEETDTMLTIKRDNGTYCEIDFVEDTIFFSNFDLFNAFRTNMSDLLCAPFVDENGNNIYFKVTDSTDIQGVPIRIHLSPRGIPLDIYEGKKYIPFQTFNDMFLSFYGFNYLFNSKDVFKVGGDGTLDESLKEEYYSLQPTQRSQALADFTAKELCLMLDIFYGLQDEHGIYEGFEEYLKAVGLWEDLTSTDATKASTALASLTMGYLADLHSGLDMASPYTGAEDVDRSKVQIASSYTHFREYLNEIRATRAEMVPEGFPGYEEVGDTAYITFDAFTLSVDRDKAYSQAPDWTEDTLGLIIYAHSMITRENSPIENVVLDLSCNTGGTVDAAVYVVAWMLGECDLHLINPVTSSFSGTSYKVDVNLDGLFNSKDTIRNKNLYCLISPVSFSCGNLVPSLLKDSGRVTLLGGTSGGGACAVQLACLADGTLFRFSSPRHLSVVTNGSYYTVDQGVEPHYYMLKMESFFDRQALTEYIQSMS